MKKEKEFRIHVDENGQVQINGNKFLGQLDNEHLSRQNAQLAQLNNTSGNYNNFIRKNYTKEAVKNIRSIRGRNSTNESFLQTEPATTPHTHIKSSPGLLRFSNFSSTSQDSVSQRQIMNNFMQNRSNHFSSRLSFNNNEAQKNEMQRFLQQNVIDKSNPQMQMFKDFQSNQNEREQMRLTADSRPKTQILPFRAQLQSRVCLSPKGNLEDKAFAPLLSPKQKQAQTSQRNHEFQLAPNFEKIDLQKLKNIQQMKQKIKDDMHNKYVEAITNNYINESTPNPTDFSEVTEPYIYSPSSHKAESKIVKQIQISQQYQRQQIHHENQKQIRDNFQSKFKFQDDKRKIVQVQKKVETYLLTQQKSFKYKKQEEDPPKTTSTQRRQISDQNIKQWVSNLDELIIQRKDRQMKARQSQLDFVRQFEHDAANDKKIIREKLAHIFCEYIQKLQEGNQKNDGKLKDEYERKVHLTIQKTMVEAQINIKQDKRVFRDILNESWYYWRTLKGMQQSYYLQKDQIQHQQSSGYHPKMMRKYEFDKIKISRGLSPEIRKSILMNKPPAEEKLQEGKNNQRMRTSTRQAIDNQLRQSVKDFWNQQEQFQKETTFHEIQKPTEQKKTRRNHDVVLQTLVNTQESEKIQKYGRFRYLVAKHFLSKSLEQIDSKQSGQITMSLVIKLAQLLQILDMVFPDIKGGSYDCLGKKYDYLCQNIFKNTYISDRWNVLIEANIEEPLCFHKVTCNQNYLEDMNMLTRVITQKAQFFREAKKMKPFETDGFKHLSMQAYSQVLEKGDNIVFPNFMSFLEGSVILREMNINTSQAEAFKLLFDMTTNTDQHQVTQLVIDNCTFSDSDLAQMLSGLEQQGRLKSISISNCIVDNKGITKLCLLMQNANEIRLSNIINFKRLLIQQMVQHIFYQCKQVQILQLNNINLNCQYSIDYLCRTIRSQFYLHTIQLSRCYIQTTNLYVIAQALLMNPGGLKQLDLSYNLLWNTNDRPKKEEDDYSGYCLWTKSDLEIAHMFIDLMIAFLKKTQMLCHLNMSGLQLSKIDRSKLIELFENMTKCDNLLVVHLSDNDLHIEQDVDQTNQEHHGDGQHELDQFEELMGAFGLRYRDIVPKKIFKAKPKQSDEPTESKTDQLYRVKNDTLKIGETIRKAYMDDLLSKIDRPRILDQQESSFSLRKQSKYNDKEQQLTAKLDYQFEKDQKDLCLLQLENYKILLEFQQKYVNQNKILNQSLVNGGLGRQSFKNSNDIFIIQRHCNYPELIFNQDYDKDYLVSGTIGQYFNVDQPHRWKYSGKPVGCHLCQRHVYTTIFFDKIVKNNKDLVQITDKRSLKLIRNHFQKEMQNSSFIPFISGTVISQDSNNLFTKDKVGFNRNLKMLRADMFTVLSVSHTVKIVKKPKHFRLIKEGLISMLEADNIQSNESVDLDDVNLICESEQFVSKLKGWQKLLVDKCCNNEIQTIRRINFPERIQEPKYDSEAKSQNQIYVYAAFLKPGFHEFIIYDQDSDTAWCKEFTLDLNNQQVAYPELPRQMGARLIEIIPNVWNPWKEDSEQNIQMSIINDTNTNVFELELFIKNKGSLTDPIKEMVDILTDHFNMIKVFQKELMYRSAKYPDIDFDSFAEVMMKMSENQNQKKKKKITKNEQKELKAYRANVEIIFIRATRNDKAVGLGGGLCRGELMESIVRMSQQVSQEKQPVENLKRYLYNFVKPITDQSDVYLVRNIIRKSAMLNQLLHDNRDGLMLVYQKYQTPSFTFEKADLLLNTCGNLGPNQLLQCIAQAQIKSREEVMKRENKMIEDSRHECKLLEPEQLRKVFCFSMMTVLNEIKNQKKHEYLLYIEFVEMICRVAHYTQRGNGDIAYKVYNLLQILYSRRYKQNLNKPEQGDLNLLPVKQKEQEEDEDDWVF